jgi:hypothetical protein
MSLNFVQGDTAPDLNATLHLEEDAESVIDLTDATVRFQMRQANDRRYTVNAEADIIDEEAGTVRYQWAPNDLAQPGEYEAQWEVTYPDTTIQTTTPPAILTVRRQ